MVELNDTDLQSDFLSNAAPWPNTRRHMRITHKPTGISASRDISNGGVVKSRLEAIEEILDKLEAREREGELMPKTDQTEKDLEKQDKKDQENKEAGSE